MSGIGFDQQQFVKEAEAFTQRLGRGLQALAGCGDVQIGATAKTEIYREDKVTLYRYTPFEDIAAKDRIRVPLVICYALVNRPYMLDLQPDRSLIRGLLSRGVDVYLIDWGYPDGADRYLTVDDYVNGYLHRCVSAVKRTSEHARVNLLGVCQGGTLSLCYTALHGAEVRNLVTMVTPVDFRTPDNLLSKWSEHVDIDAMVDTLGNIPGSLLNSLFLGMQPFRLGGKKYIDVLDHIDNPRVLENFVRMEKWIFDSPDQPGEMFRQFMRWFIRENRLIEGTLQLESQPVRLKDIKVPVFNVYASQDHLVPPSASIPLEKHIGSRDYESYAFDGGHIGIYVSGAAQREVPGRIAQWLKKRDGRP